MNVFSLFTFTVLAAESLISPIPATSETPVVAPLKVEKPSSGFGSLSSFRIETNESVLPTVTPAPTAISPSLAKLLPTPYSLPPHKSKYTIALLGDSMIDTLGPEAPHLKGKLSAMYPNVTFTIRNFGVGGTNIAYGIERLRNSYAYLGVQIPSVVSTKPDLVVVESFGYNPFSFDTGALDKHWLSLATIVDIIHSSLPGTKILIASTIAPNRDVFGDGAPGLSFSSEDKVKRTDNIKRYLENAIKFARGEHIPLADVYHASLDGNGNGKLQYINPGDHIHYSDAGRLLFAQKVSETIASNNLLN
ncbi:SGNH/GDSL hydrolase family protein [Candidatus Gottesmanbacteria bacterium]|nr:SGNH/GDSL hydrolase family protein [Candidatus Gottesmanbacteria bacterium]